MRGMEMSLIAEVIKGSDKTKLQNYIKSYEDQEEQEKAKNIALIEAVKLENIEIIEFLICEGANIKFCNEKKENSVVLAAKSKERKILRLLLEKIRNLESKRNRAFANRKTVIEDLVSQIESYSIVRK